MANDQSPISNQQSQIASPERVPAVCQLVFLLQDQWFVSAYTGVRDHQRLADCRQNSQEFRFKSQKVLALPFRDH